MLVIYQNEGLLKFAGSHIHHKCDSVSEMVQGRDILLQTAIRKWYVAHQIVAFMMPLSDLQGHSLSASLFQRDIYHATLCYYSICCHHVSIRLSVYPSVSVTRQYCTKMAKPRITQTTPYDNPWTV